MQFDRSMGDHTLKRTLYLTFCHIPSGYIVGIVSNFGSQSFKKKSTAFGLKHNLPIEGKRQHQVTPKYNDDAATIKQFVAIQRQS